MSNRCFDLDNSAKKTELPDGPEHRAPHPTNEGSMAKEDFNKIFKDAAGSSQKADSMLEKHFDKGNAPVIIQDGSENVGRGGGGRGGAEGNKEKNSDPTGKGDHAHGEKNHALDKQKVDRAGATSN